MSERLPAQTLADHRDRALRAWALPEGIVLLPSGLPVPIEGTDGHHEFHVHAEHYYLTGLSRPGQVLAFDSEGGFTLFAHLATQEERIWEGDTESFEALKKRTRIDRVLPIWDLGPWMEERAGRRAALLGNPDLLTRPEGYGLTASPSAHLEFDSDLTRAAREAITGLRRVKDGAELDLMRRACAATRAGHLAAIRGARPGMTELALRAEIEVEFLRAGGSRPAYTTIVASARNAATLHSAPSHRALGEGELVLVDAGAEFGGYKSDVTRTFPVDRTFTSEQREIYDLVLEVQEAAIDGCVPGQEYRELHMKACVGIARGLVDLGILRGEPEGLVDRDTHALFFPHGLGHMIGLGTHDMGGYLPERKRSERFGLKFLRADLPLLPGHVVTIEPGIYFIEALLTDPAIREEHRDSVNWGRVDGMLEFGGIRIEDDVHVTDGRPEVLTTGIPKQARDLEDLRPAG